MNTEVQAQVIRNLITSTNVLRKYFSKWSERNRSPFSDFSSVPDAKLDWLLADEGGTKRLLSSSLPWITSPLSELFRESLRADRDEDVLLLSLKGLLEFKPVQVKHTKRNVIPTNHFGYYYLFCSVISKCCRIFSIYPILAITYHYYQR